MQAILPSAYSGGWTVVQIVPAVSVVTCILDRSIWQFLPIRGTSPGWIETASESWKQKAWKRLLWRGDCLIRLPFALPLAGEVVDVGIIALRHCRAEALGRLPILCFSAATSGNHCYQACPCRRVPLVGASLCRTLLEQPEQACR